MGRTLIVQITHLTSLTLRQAPLRRVVLALQRTP